MKLNRNSILNSKAQSGSMAGAMILIIMVLIILYILFLPPAEREDLLSGGTGTGGHGTVIGGGTIVSANTPLGVIFRENIGKIYEPRINQKDIDLPAFTIATQTSGGIIKTKTSAYIKSSAFEEITDTMDFQITPGLSDNLILSFTVIKGTGNLKITLNNKVVYFGEIKQGNSPPIYLSKDDLSSTNTLVFSVNGPGIAFWKYNDYSLTDLKITGDITDVSSSTAYQAVTIAERDLVNFKSARFRYLAECTQGTVDRFEVKLNGQRLFSGRPDCAIYTYLPIDSNQLRTGNNEFEFSVENGRVLVDRAQLQIMYNEPVYPTYYFQMHDDYFVKKKADGYCGKADGICPTGCQSYEDVDCCLKRSDNYWCDIPTTNPNDRCVSFINDCDRCLSGYEDRSGNVPNKCKADGPYCGNDKDGICPDGCSAYYDKDCCFEIEGAYWCNDMPEKGVENICKQFVADYECNDCPYGYRNKAGRSPDCRTTSTSYDEEETLKTNFKVMLNFAFPNTDQKRLEVFVNGKLVGINTAQITYETDISLYVRSGTNSIEIRPKGDPTITEMRITVK